MKTVIFVCVHNSGRSQMAEAFFNRLAEGKARAISAGTRPAVHTDRTVVVAMKELGIDISLQRPKLLTFEMLEKADHAITMGCGVEETCPASFIPTEDWRLDDPEGKSLEEVRIIRDTIKAKVEALVQEMVVPGGRSATAHGETSA
ncbi:MAG: arsenate reductase [Chloroflexi bacterium RBG_16_56_11]|nr:MAG: arsenate reductase [Chloroflexi bacterium RBG_16_56_11]